MMTTLPIIGSFERDQFNDLISKILEEKNKTIKESYYKKIVKEIIISKAICDSLFEGPSVNEIQGVPFDLIGLKNNEIYIIELKS